jgi:hypothetical protein
VHLCGVNRQLQFVLGLAEVFLCLGAVALHVVVVGRAGSLHFVDRFNNVLVNIIEVVPIVNLSRNQRAGNKRKSKTGNSKWFPHFLFLRAILVVDRFPMLQSEQINAPGK